jgi:hypothetical protein
MKFTDKKYIGLEDVDLNIIDYIEFEPYQIGFDDSYDDIILTLKINSDGSMDLNYNTETLNMFSQSGISQTDMDKMIIMFKEQLLMYPFPTDYYELKYS